MTVLIQMSKMMMTATTKTKARMSYMMMENMQVICLQIIHHMHSGCQAMCHRQSLNDIVIQ
eukprot:2099582-Ditylum_brightwellii.AAC.1